MQNSVQRRSVTHAHTRALTEEGLDEYRLILDEQWEHENAPTGCALCCGYTDMEEEFPGTIDDEDAENA